ncbi:MAG TPA: radical SAM family heme chaperone HemW [Bacteroidales bacterium]|nr:radical SAM family heme chaperone HemW [Bacteroidales bacterium]HOH21841.1 radical SAM family heme chaperone HemW [Bacteroidales bacterium]HPZ02737.1 radical SAM family heme chaperone HemW [Bacteroidales bacterium]HQB74363.1 radical SAM family heme chaperone HemW [Bacteroidales bacterium]
MSAVYIHFPYCNSKCLYCNFYSETNLNTQKRFIRALQKEIELRSGELRKDTVKTIYFGGGTPSLTPVKDMALIVEALKRHFKIAAQIEFTVEINPEQATPDFLRALRKLGVNRISMGVQSFDDRILHFLGRRHTAQQALEGIRHIREAEIDNISIDLIYGIIIRGGDEWLHDLEVALSQSIQHLSAYALTLEENSILYKELVQKNPAAYQVGKDMDENIALRDMNLLLQQIANTPFKRYEISNFAVPGYESKHNSAYWDGTPYLGLGPSAHSFDGATRSWNVSSIETYCKALESGEGSFEVEDLSLTDHYNERILLTIRTAKGIDLKKIEEQFGEVYFTHLMNEIALLNKAWYQIENDHLILTEAGVALTDHITVQLLYDSIM